MKNNYPIKYAVMPIYEHSGYAVGLYKLEHTYDISLYIVSKCYLIEESVCYQENGEKKSEYKIVYPYENDDNSYSLARCEPEFGYNNQPTNCFVVDNVFDDFDSCFTETERLNKEIFYKKIGNMPFTEDFSKKVELFKEKYNKKIQEYRKLEKRIEDSSSDLVVGNNYKKQNIVVCSEDKQFISRMSLYGFINLSNRDNFCVYNVSIDEFATLCSQIEEDKDINITTSRLLLYHEKNTEITMITDCDSDKSKGSFYLKDKSMYYNKDMIPFHLDKNIIIDGTFIKVYTMESYEDIIKSYITKYINRDNSDIEIGNMTISKVLKLK